jgi:hypothetical protein
MMLLPKRIRSLLNGGAAQAGVKGLQEAIAAIEADMAAHRRELAEIPGKCADAALADDGAAQVSALRSREEQLYAELEVAEIQIGRLRDKLRDQVDHRRRDLIEHHRRLSRAAHEEAIPTLFAAIAANEKMKLAYAAAERELGAGDAARLVGNFSFLLPGFTGEVIDHWVAVTRRDGEAAASRAALVRGAQAVVNAPRFSTGSYGDGDTARTEKNLAPRRVAPDRQAAPRPQSPAKPLRPLYDDAAKEGERRVRILRSGYEDPAGRACRLGDTIALPQEIADKAVASGACDFADLTPPLRNVP